MTYMKKASPIDAKIKVLREFAVVNDRNEKSIRNKLEAAIVANPDMDPEIVLDRVARPMIMAILNR